MVNHDNIILIFFVSLVWNFLLFCIWAFLFRFFHDLSFCLNICWFFSLNHLFLDTGVFLLFINMFTILFCLLFQIFAHNWFLLLLNFLFFQFYLLLLNINLLISNFFCLFWNLHFNNFLINLLAFPLIYLFLFNFFNLLIIFAYLFFCLSIYLDCLLIFIWKFFLRYLLRILDVVSINNFFCFLYCHFMGLF